MNRQRFSNLLGVACVAIVLLTAVSPAAAYDTSGFIYGKITTERGATYEGRIRWGNEEAFWGDYFNSVKEDRPFDHLAKKDRGRREPIKIFGITIGVRWDEDYDASRMFKTRFGDIQRIEVGRGGEATLLMKSGREYDIDGGSNDIGGEISVFFVLVVAAAEVVVGLAIIVSIMRRRAGATADDISVLRG